MNGLTELDHLFLPLLICLQSRNPEIIEAHLSSLLSKALNLMSVTEMLTHDNEIIRQVGKKLQEFGCGVG